MSTDRVNLTLPRDVRALLRDIGEGARGTQSHYVASILRSHAREWQESLEVLRHAGWGAEEILAACDALNGLWLMAGMGASVQISGTLGDSAALDGLVDRHDTGPLTWDGLVRGIAESETLARALWVVTQEWWAGNAVLDRVLERMGADTQATA